MDEHTLNDLLECSVCLERLDTKSKVLPCQHTFCKKCLEVIVSSQSELRCPECRVLVDCKINDLPTNVLLMRILEGMKNASNNDNNSQSNRKLNAEPKLADNTNKLATKSKHIDAKTQQQYQQQQQHHQQQQIHENPLSIQSNNKRQQQQQQKPIQEPILQIYRNNQPYANAIHDFISNEIGDLNFKRGDKILLKNRIDINWYFGEWNGKDGAFPINHVQIIIPLPLPQCKALYDFRMGPNEEEGCLTFKKGEIINVFCRVDQNWAEGRVDDCIGIFPIAFVEMNTAAKQLMENSSINTSSSVITPRPVPSTPHDLHNNHSSDSISTLISSTSPSSISDSNTSSSSNTSPNSPISPQQQQPSHQKNQPLTDDKINKRLHTNPRDENVNRYSAELVLHPNETKIREDRLSLKLNAQQLSKVLPTNKISSSSLAATAAAVPHVTNSHVHKPTANTNNFINSYIAIYPYKPQKPDELELVKGSVYYVTERCQDGWFKGMDRSHKLGVFPGNFVVPLRNSRSLEASQVTNCNTALPSTSTQEKRSKSKENTKREQIVEPPQLPPRLDGSSTSSSVWSKPLGQHVEALFGRKFKNETTNESSPSSMITVTTKETKNSSTSTSTSSTVDLIKRFANIKLSKSLLSTPATTYSMDNPVFEDVIGATAANTSDLSNRRNTNHLSQSVHVRSGSCPSQLLQSLPIDINQTISEATIKKLDPTGANGAYLFGSQRVKNHKERIPLTGIRNHMDNNRYRTDINASQHNAIQRNVDKSHVVTSRATASILHHRKSQSMDAVTTANQLGKMSIASGNRNKMPTSKERFRCIVSYPPNSDFELELMVGDIVYVHKKRENGWYKGTHERTGKIGLFPSSFVEPDI